MRFTKFHDFEVEIFEHKRLNYSKGVIYSNDLRYISKEDILNELKAQNGTEVDKIIRKKDNNLKETGLIILTYATTTLPETINIGYEHVKIRPHIPGPLKCRNCQKFNHPTKACNNEKTCSNCSEVHSPDDEDCTKPKFCINCKHLDNHHIPLDQNCPTFINVPVLDKSDTREITTYDDIMKPTLKTPSENDIEMDTTESYRTSKKTTISDRSLRSHNKEKTNPLVIPLKAKSKADKSKPVNTNQLKHSKESKQHLILALQETHITNFKSLPISINYTLCIIVAAPTLTGAQLS